MKIHYAKKNTTQLFKTTKERRANYIFTISSRVPRGQLVKPVNPSSHRTKMKIIFFLSQLMWTVEGRHWFAQIQGLAEAT